MKKGIDIKALIQALDEIEKKDNISKEYILDALETALIAAYQEQYETNEEVKVNINRETGEIDIFQTKVVVEKVEDEKSEISLEDAKAIKKKYKLGDVIEISIDPKDFGRIAVQKGKQIIVQKLREGEKNAKLEEYQAKSGEVVNGLIEKTGNYVVVDLGKVEGYMPIKEQVPTENYKVNQKIRVYIKDVRLGEKGNLKVLVSRSSENFVKKLFEYEIPEINEGIIKIMSVARIPGVRSKIAVYSENRNIDPVGSCVGEKGIRIQSVIDELAGEKIDVVEWSEEPQKFIADALLPAEVMAVDVNEETKFAQVIVADDQLSLAIGKSGQNARLAVNLTKYNIDIKSESQFRKILEELAEEKGSFGIEDIEEKSTVTGKTKQEENKEIEKELEDIAAITKENEDIENLEIVETEKTNEEESQE